jgi:hypothetical protein
VAVAVDVAVAGGVLDGDAVDGTGVDAPHADVRIATAAIAAPGNPTRGAHVMAVTKGTPDGSVL